MPVLFLPSHGRILGPINHAESRTPAKRSMLIENRRQGEHSACHLIRGSVLIKCFLLRASEGNLPGGTEDSTSLRQKSTYRKKKEKKNKPPDNFSSEIMMFVFRKYTLRFSVRLHSQLSFKG